MDKYGKLKDLIKKEKPNIRDITLDSYLKYLINLHKDIFNSKEFTSFNWLNNYDKVMDSIKEKSYLTQRNILNAVIVALNAGKGKTEVIDKYSNLRDNFNKQYLENVANGKNKKQDDNMISRKELDEYINTYEKIIKVKKCRSNKNMTPKELKEFQMFVILKFYQKYPLRADLATFKFINSEDEKEDGENYYLWNKGIILMNTYKTSKKYGNYTINLDKDINALFKCLIKKKTNKNNNYLITKINGEPMSKKEFSNLVIQFFKTNFNKRIGVTLLRKIYLQKYSDVKKDMEKDAQLLGHSVATQQGIYVK